jgi:hypothetical protein
MAINVYWACCEDQWMLANAPEPVSSIFYNQYFFNKDHPDTQINYCPAFNKNLQNLFAIRSIYDYNFELKNQQVVTEMYDQHFFNQHIVIRSLDHKFFSFVQSFIFFTDANDLEMSAGEFPFLEDNNITKSCIILPGKFNIAKWFRPIEFSFYLKKDYDCFKIERNEIYSYLRFHTNEKINFIQFRYTDLLEQYKNDGFNLNFFRYLKNLKNYYSFFKNKKLILKEIRENIL